MSSQWRLCGVPMYTTSTSVSFGEGFVRAVAMRDLVLEGEAIGAFLRAGADHNDLGIGEQASPRVKSDGDPAGGGDAPADRTRSVDRDGRYHGGRGYRSLPWLRFSTSTS